MERLIIARIFLPIVLAFSIITGSGELIHACVTPSTGAVRIIVDGTACRADETSLEWGMIGLQGPQGIPVRSARRDSPGNPGLQARPG
jgi:hypothetical protein